MELTSDGIGINVKTNSNTNNIENSLEFDKFPLCLDTTTSVINKTEESLQNSITDIIDKEKLISNTIFKVADTLDKQVLHSDSSKTANSKKLPQNSLSCFAMENTFISNNLLEFNNVQEKENLHTVSSEISNDIQLSQNLIVQFNEGEKVNSDFNDSVKFDYAQTTASIGFNVAKQKVNGNVGTGARDDLQCLSESVEGGGKLLFDDPLRPYSTFNINLQQNWSEKSQSLITQSCKTNRNENLENIQLHQDYISEDYQINQEHDFSIKDKQQQTDYKNYSIQSEQSQQTSVTLNLDTKESHLTNNNNNNNNSGSNNNNNDNINNQSTTNPNKSQDNKQTYLQIASKLLPTPGQIGIEPTQGITIDCAVVIERLPNTNLDVYCKAISWQLGNNYIIFLGRAPKDPNKILVFLQNPKLAEKLVYSGIFIRGRWVMVSYKRSPATRVVLSDVLPYIPDGLLVDALQPFGVVALPKMRKIRAATSHSDFKKILSYRRETYLYLNPEVNLPPFLKIEFEGDIHEIEVSTTGVKCFNCGKYGHAITYCDNFQEPLGKEISQEDRTLEKQEVDIKGKIKSQLLKAQNNQTSKEPLRTTVNLKDAMFRTNNKEGCNTRSIREIQMWQQLEEMMQQKEAIRAHEILSKLSDYDPSIHKLSEDVWEEMYKEKDTWIITYEKENLIWKLIHNFKSEMFKSNTVMNTITNTNTDNQHLPIFTMTTQHQLVENMRQDNEDSQTPEKKEKEQWKTVNHNKSKSKSSKSVTESDTRQNNTIEGTIRKEIDKAKAQKQEKQLETNTNDTETSTKKEQEKPKLEVESNIKTPEERINRDTSLEHQSRNRDSEKYKESNILEDKSEKTIINIPLNKTTGDKRGSLKIDKKSSKTQSHQNDEKQIQNKQEIKSKHKEQRYKQIFEDILLQPASTSSTTSFRLTGPINPNTSALVTKNLLDEIKFKSASARLPILKTYKQKYPRLLEYLQTALNADKITYQTGQQQYKKLVDTIADLQNIIKPPDWDMRSHHSRNVEEMEIITSQVTKRKKDTESTIFSMQPLVEEQELQGGARKKTYLHKVENI